MIRMHSGYFGILEVSSPSIGILIHIGICWCLATNSSQLDRHFPNIHAEPLTFGEKIAKMLRRTCQQTAFLIAEWERIGS